MNIAYKGTFLREGLQENGHQVYNLVLDGNTSLDSALKSLPVPIDLVVWEFYGAFSNIRALSPCETPLAAYCIDTPINEFWLKPCMRNIDYVFVDQPQCVKAFCDSGIRASWLPLPAQKSWFLPWRPKKRELTFIGTTSKFRQKRSNLLNLIQAKFKLDILSGLDLATAQSVFSESKVILNENFFPGLTLRVLQGLSAGTVVFTEHSPYGDNFGVADGRDLVCYNPDNVLDRLSDLLENYEKYYDISINGQQKCKELYSCGRVASDLVAAIVTDGMRKKQMDQNEQDWNRIFSELMFGQRFGGNLSRSMTLLKEIAASSEENAADAHRLLGDIQLRFKGGHLAREHYETALEMDPGNVAALKLALLYIYQKKPDIAIKSVLSWIKSQDGFKCDLGNVLGEGKDMGQGILKLIGEIYLFLGRRWDMGFQKAFNDPVPDTAFDVAEMAWRLYPSSWSLDMMTRCLRPSQLQGELLPYLLEGEKLGLLSETQLLETAQTAFNYYDWETATRIMGSLKKPLNA